MYTLDIRKSRIFYIGFTVFCFVFQLIYEHFSHGVISYYMTCAFLIPLAGGILSELFLRMLEMRKMDYHNLAWQLLAGGVIWLTLGSLFQGALEIYGTTNHLTKIFPIVGIIQIVLALMSWSKLLIEDTEKTQN